VMVVKFLEVTMREALGFFEYRVFWSNMGLGFGFGERSSAISMGKLFALLLAVGW